MRKKIKIRITIFTGKGSNEGLMRIKFMKIKTKRKPEDFKINCVFTY